MVEVFKIGVILDKTNRGFENEGVFNPAVIEYGAHIHVFYRAVRKGNYSTLGHALLDHPINLKSRHPKPILVPEFPYEKHGIEDPRIVRIDEQFLLTYSAYDGRNVLGALAVSTDLQSFEKRGIVVPQVTYETYRRLLECCDGIIDKYFYHYRLFKEHGLRKELVEKLLVWDKNVVFFPRKIHGQYAMLHRIHPGIQLVYFDALEDLTPAFWEQYLLQLSAYIVMDPELPHESSHIGGGAPPIETPDGWLLIYHAAEDTPHGLVYHAAAALLDLNDPRHVIGRLTEPLLSPQFRWEKEGYISNIIFPTGTVLQDDDLYIYYGATDSKVAVARVSLQALLTALKATSNEEKKQ